MKYTNKLNLPTAFTNFYQTTEENIIENRYSVTELLKPIQEIILFRKHANEIYRDVADCIPALFGTAVHELLEKNADENVLSEYKFEQEFYGKVLVGKCDVLDLSNLEINDYKTSSASKVMKGDFSDYYKQDMMYALMAMIKFDVKIKKLRNYILIKDWSKLKANVMTGYPQSPIYTWEYDVQDSDFDYIRDFIKNRFAEIDEGIKDCTLEEKWYTGDKYAVYKKAGDKRAAKVLDSEQEAHDFITNQCGGAGEIQVRKGENLKCKYYCDLKNFCSQYRKENEENG